MAFGINAFYSSGLAATLTDEREKFISGTTEIIIFDGQTDTITYSTSQEGLLYWVFTDLTSAWFGFAHHKPLSVGHGSMEMD